MSKPTIVTDHLEMDSQDENMPPTITVNKYKHVIKDNIEEVCNCQALLHSWATKFDVLLSRQFSPIMKMQDKKRIFLTWYFNVSN